jgi:hypothetical protein
VPSVVDPVVYGTSAPFAIVPPTADVWVDFGDGGAVAEGGRRVTYGQTVAVVRADRGCDVGGQRLWRGPLFGRQRICTKRHGKNPRPNAHRRRAKLYRVGVNAAGHVAVVPQLEAEHGGRV